MRRLKQIFDDQIRPGDVVIHTISDETLVYVSEYEPNLTSVVKHRGTTSVPFLVANKNVVKFRAYMFFELIEEKASGLNKRLARRLVGKKNVQAVQRSL